MTALPIAFFLTLALTLAITALHTTPKLAPPPASEPAHLPTRTTTITDQISLLLPAGIAERITRAQGTAALLARAGNPWTITPTQFTTICLALAVAGAFTGMALPTLGYPTNPLIAIPILTTIGYYTPKVLLASKWSARRNSLQNGIPEALDLIRIALGSGKTFANALSEAATHMRASVTQIELTQTGDAIRSGQPITSALIDLNSRCPTDEIDAFTRAVIQGERIGADISRTLEHQAAEARRNYERLIDVKAQKMMTTLFIPILGLLLPALCIYLFGSAFASLQTLL